MVKKYKPRDPQEKDNILGKTLDQKMASVLKVKLTKEMIGYGERQEFLKDKDDGVSPDEKVRSIKVKTPPTLDKVRYVIIEQEEE